MNLLRDLLHSELSLAGSVMARSPALPWVMSERPFADWRPQVGIRLCQISSGSAWDQKLSNVLESRADHESQAHAASAYGIPTAAASPAICLGTGTVVGNCSAGALTRPKLLDMFFKKTTTFPGMHAGLYIWGLVPAITCQVHDLFT